MTIENHLPDRLVLRQREGVEGLQSRGKLMALALGVSLSLVAVLPEGTLAAVTGVSDGNWTEHGGTPQGIRYSELNGINASNVSRLVEEQSLSLGLKGGYMGAPLFVKDSGGNDWLFALTPYPNQVFAFKRNGTSWGQVWASGTSPSAPLSGNSKGSNCCDSTNRGFSFVKGIPTPGGAKDLLVYVLLDGRAVAVDAWSGKRLWIKRIADPKVGVTTTGAPVVTKDKKVVFGTSSGEMGTRGYVVALDMSNGNQAWKYYTTGPDADVGIDGNTSLPYYRDSQGKNKVNLGASTWEGGTKKYMEGGSSVWSYLTYDPDTDTVYFGTSQPGVWNPNLRPGDNKWGASIFARAGSTGKAKWIYQTVPHDNWDYDAVAEIVPVDFPDGKKVVVQFNKNGFVYTIDRTNGNLYAADLFREAIAEQGDLTPIPAGTSINWADSVDLSTGLPMLGGKPATDAHNSTTNAPNQKNFLTTNKWPETNCPGPFGAHGWEPSSYSPPDPQRDGGTKGVFFVPTFNMCAKIGPRNAEFIAGAPYMGMDMSFKIPDPTRMSDMIAWDPVKRTKIWSQPEGFPIYSGVLSTAGNVVFYGTLASSNNFKARDARTGALLTQTTLSSGCPTVGSPITFLGSDNVQRVAVYSGTSAIAGGFSQVGKACGTGNLHIFKLQ